MRVVMSGHQTWGHRTLRALLDSEHAVVLVVTHPKSDHAYEKIWSDSAAEPAEEHGVPAFTHHRGARVRVTKASVSRGTYGGTPGRVFIPEGDGVVIVAGAEARRGRSHGLVIERVRTEDGTDLPATEFFRTARTMGGYLTSRP